MATDHAFLKRLHLRARTGRICRFGCLKALENNTDRILSYRHAFRSLPKSKQDRDLLWVFGGGHDEFLQAPQEPPVANEEPTSPSSSSNRGQPMEQTSTSGSEGDHVLQPSPKSVAESCDHARKEHTSASDNEAAMQQQCAISASDAEAPQEFTTPSEDFTLLGRRETSRERQKHSFTW